MKIKLKDLDACVKMLTSIYEWYLALFKNHLLYHLAYNIHIENISKKAYIKIIYSCPQGQEILL